MTRLLLLLASAIPLFAADSDYFPAVAKLVEDRCLDCHSDDDPDGKFSMESHASFLKGGESGPAFKPGQSKDSLLLKYLRGEVEKDGKKKFMPPGKRDKLTPEEIDAFAKWIDAGARPPQKEMGKKVVEVPKVLPKNPPKLAVTALAFSPLAQKIAVGKYGVVEIVESRSQTVVQRLEGHRGNVNALIWSTDGTQLFAASGENAVQGEVTLWNLADAKPVRTFKGHRDTIYALALSPDGQTLATGSYDQKIKLWNVADGAERKTLPGHNGAVFGLAFRPDGRLLASASADRTVKLWDVATGERRDTLSQPQKEQVAVAWSEDGQRLAAAGADNRIRVWKVTPEARETTNPLLVARFAHEQPILRLSWQGSALLSGAQDGTVKVWDAAEIKERLSLEKQPDWPTALTFAGQVLVIGRGDGTLGFYDQAGKALAPKEGAQRRMEAPRQKLFEIEPVSLPFQSSLEITEFQSLCVFAPLRDNFPVRPLHGASDSREVFPNEPGEKDHAKAQRRKERHFAPGVTIAGSEVSPCAERTARPRRILCQAPAKKEPAAKPAAPPPKPEVTSVSPRGILRGEQADVLLHGKNLPPTLTVKSSDPRVQIFTGTPTDSQIPLILRTPGDLPRSGYDLIVSGADGKEIGRATLRINDLPVLDFPAASTQEAIALFPVSVWGTLARPGESDRYDFTARASQTLIFDVAAKSAQSKADFTLNLVDAAGRVLASSNNFDGGEPFIAHKFSKDGRYTLVVGEAQMGGGDSFLYNITMGELPFVVGTFPLSIPANAESKVELIGFNLPEDAALRTVIVKAGSSGMAPLPLDTDRLRLRTAASIAISDFPDTVEKGGNHSPGNAHALPVPSSVNGRIRTPGQPDFFQFTARKGVVYAIETDAARRGSPIDSKIAVLDSAGAPIPRLLFQAVRDSAINFRPTDSVTPDVRVENWREMELNELMWTSGEINKIFRMPEGPDSGFAYYAEGGKRIALYNTSPVAHALDEPCYIVEPHPPGTPLTANGLPVFTLHYQNDDDGDRELGSDSRLLFTAPADGDYLVRVQDSRGFGGERFAYRLIIREARHDFTVRTSDFDGTVNAGSGAAFTLVADRRDGFDGDIRCDIAGIPEGWHVTTPLVIQAGHLRARGSLNALPGAKPPTAEQWKAVKITARATVENKETTREVAPLAIPKLQGAPNVYVGIVTPALGKHQPDRMWEHFDPAKPSEFSIAPGEIIPAWLVIKRGDAKGALRFDVENLPHGVIVDNLGLNGITLLEGQEHGEIFFKAAPWVQPQDRLAFAVVREGGKQASLPFILHVRHKDQKSDIVNVK